MMRKTKTDNEKLLKEVISKSRDKKSLTSKLEIDDMVNHYIEISEDKQDFVKKMVRDINKSINKKKMGKNRDYFSSINSYCKGKLFYIAYKSGKYMRISTIEKKAKQEYLLGMVKEIETGQEYAWDLIDAIEDRELKDFLYGIFTYIYY